MQSNEGFSDSVVMFLKGLAVGVWLLTRQYANLPHELSFE